LHRRQPRKLDRYHCTSMPPRMHAPGVPRECPNPGYLPQITYQWPGAAGAADFLSTLPARKRPWVELSRESAVNATRYRINQVRGTMMGPRHTAIVPRAPDWHRMGRGKGRRSADQPGRRTRKMIVSTNSSRPQGRAGWPANRYVFACRWPPPRAACCRAAPAPRPGATRIRSARNSAASTVNHQGRAPPSACIAAAFPAITRVRSGVNGP